MEYLFLILILLFSIVIHEVSHGTMALALGDPTAKYAGRLTLNPLKHLDPFGSVILPLILLFFTAGRGPIFGWAKPVPINPYNFPNPKWDEAKVALAGPGSNFLVALFFGFLIRFFPLPGEILTLFSLICILNLLLAIFNLIPIPPLDGSHILFSLLPERYSQLRMIFEQYSLLILLIFIFFGLNWVFLGVNLLYYLITSQPFII